MNRYLKYFFQSDFKNPIVAYVNWKKCVVDELGCVIGFFCEKCDKSFLKNKFKKSSVKPSGYSSECFLCAGYYISNCCHATMTRKEKNMLKREKCPCSRGYVDIRSIEIEFFCDQCQKSYKI